MSMNDGITYVGMDAHKKAINVAVLVGADKEPQDQWQIANDPKSVKKMFAKVERMKPGAKIRCTYEAGPCGYALHRQIVALGIDCMVTAPSMIPVKPGERIKTDRRDARKLSQLLRGGLLTEVHPPTEEEEAIRDLTRAREDAKKDLMSARHRVSKMLLRWGLIYGEGGHWTGKHHTWLRSIQLPQSVSQGVLENYLWAIEQVQERLRAIEAKLEDVAGEDPYRERVGWLRCFRGIDTVTAMTLLAELHDFSRFKHPRELMCYLGLTPKENSSSDRVRRGSITKMGNGHIRRILIETAWHYRHRPTVSKEMTKRRQGQPAAVLALAERAQVRLHRRYFRLVEIRQKQKNVAITGIARELVGFIWAALRHKELPMISA
jgi:transposase